MKVEGATTVYIGIDPGINGAIAAYNPVNREIDVYDFPLVDTRAPSGTTIRKEINEAALVHWLRGILSMFHHASGAVEKVSAMPKQGVSSTFRFGYSYGLARGLLTAYCVPYVLVPPRQWKTHFRIGKDKDQARLTASQLFPAHGELFARKKDANRAEATLIARFCAETQRGSNE